MKVLITGANGMVAKAMIDYCKSIDDEVVGLTRQELDIANAAKIEEICSRENFDAILNCAAYTDVDGAETNQEICFRANSNGVENLAFAAKKFNAAFVTISTDYVFDGAKSDFYTQRDTPNPQGVYAKSKLESETKARNAYARSIVARSGWIFGTGGTNFLSVMHNLLAEGKQIKVISDSYGTPTSAKDLARRLRELAELDLPNVYHVTNAGAGTSFADFAREVCRIKNLDENLIESVSLNDLTRPAPRPKSSKLRCLFSEKFGLAPLKNWKQALEEFLSEK